ncbi:MAG: VOC family protein [Anaerohalosphaeraceae bacterium]
MKIEHIALWANDLELMLDFYVRCFGGRSSEKYRNPKTGFESYFVTFEDGARLELMRRPDVCENKTDQTIQRPGYAHIAFSVGSEQKVDELTRKLSTDGHRNIDGPRRTGDGYYESVFLDPEGNRVEITV